MEVDINKNGIYNQEILEKNRNLKIKIFHFFYNILTKKDKTNKFTLFFLHILEIIQIISYAFFNPHLNTWKISKKNIEILSIIASAFRLAPLINYITYRVYIIILLIMIFLIFCFFLIIIMQILFRKENSTIYKGFQSLTFLSIAPLTIFLFIPINEFLLLIFECYTNKFDDENDSIKCWSVMHIVYIILSVFSVCFILISLIFLNFFYFYPFQTETSTIKLNSTAEIIFLIIKLIYTIKLRFVKNEFISIAILLSFSIFITFYEFKNPTYNCNLVETIINIRNTIILWTFIMLLIAKLFHNFEINGLIYLVFMGYPVIIFISIMITKEYENDFNFKISNTFHNIKSCISKTRILIKLIDSFLEKNNFNRKYMDYKNKNEIVLKGIIKMHTDYCLDEECPLKKFIKNNGNFNVQKQSLLNYMTIYFYKAMKNFPDNKMLRLYYIQFNFSKKYNLNNVRVNLEYIKKMKNNIKDEFIIYYIENEIIKIKNKAINLNDGNESEQENIILGQNYKRLKDLITNSTKLYAEFWGIFSNNITNNLNLSKLYKIGEKLNVYLNEINYLWENNLKVKKIDLENEYIAQLYSKFLREILLDKKKAEEVQKKINEEYHNLGYKRISKENHRKSEIEYFIENQDYVILVNSNEKGKCTIFQFSNSLSYLIGYQKQEILNKPLEILMPSIFIDGHSKKVEEFIKTTHLNKIYEKESFREIEKKKSFILIKNKMGYLVPFNAKYTVFDDNDFSNSYVIKAHLESRDAKSMYAYYILTKNDFSVDNISSSAINLGLTMDLLKKYVIKLNLLIRTSRDTDLNLFDKYKNFEDEAKKIIWLYPDLIYPKDDSIKNKEKIENLINNSKKNKFNLQIIGMKYKENEIIGFVFKFIEMQKRKKSKKDIVFQEFIPSHKKEIIFDLLELRYIRALIVLNKTGFRNYRDKNDEEQIKMDIYIKKKKTANYYDLNETNRNEESEEEEEKKDDIILNKDKILELQGRDSKGIKNFIYLLKFYGEKISLIKHSPNKDEYQAGKIREPKIKIDLNNFINRIDLKLKESPSLYRRVKIEQKERARRSVSLNQNIGIKFKFFASEAKQTEIKKKQKEEINLNLAGDSTITLSNIFNEKSINNIKLVNFVIYILVISILIIEFCLNYAYINLNKKNFLFLDNSYKILNNFIYSKYFITEAIITNTLKNYYISNKYNKIDYINYIKVELGKCHNEFMDLDNSFVNAFSKNFSNYISNKNLTLKTLTNGVSVDLELPFESAMDRYSSQIFYISTISDLESINMTDKYSYELMVNLMNDYMLTGMETSILILDDIINSTKNPGIVGNVFIFISLFIIILSLFSFYKMTINFILDRERPINLFLTIKKKLFEDLKTSAENFSNKLLNKFFGNEENEEETHQDSITNIKANDINIAKFNSLHEYKTSLNKGESLMFYFGQLIVFFICFEIYMVLKYLNTLNHFSNVLKFLDIYNTTQISHTFIIIRLNVIKQYFFNDSLTNFNMEINNINYSFYKSFQDISLHFSNTIFIASKSNSYEQKKYKNLFKEYLYSDFSNFIENENIKNNTNYIDKVKSGFKPIKMEAFEILRSLSIKYFLDNKRNKSNLNISDIINDSKWYDLHEILIYFIRPWYKNIIELMNSGFYSMVDNLQGIYIGIFILLFVIITLNYFIVWKSYEEKLYNLLKKSFDLINLIPKEIKFIIVSKLNEYQ